MLCGTPFSGKSTLARALASRFDLVHIEIDCVHVERGVLAHEGNHIDDQDWLAAFQTSYRRLMRLLDQGRSVVWDATSYYRAQRDRVRKVAAAHGARVALIFLDTPEAVARARIERNRVVRSRWDIPDDDFTSLSLALEPPTADEHPIRFAPDDDLDDWMNETIAPWLGRGAQELAG
jgi:predicted kinase